ncbi:MAG: DUF3536 domain-containing protein [Elusimicrobiota bacterium]
MERYLCIHGHFYQPPRENPWLEEVETQDSAYPYHDWNERITAECYAPNTASRILQDFDKVADVVNNYSKISFNFGPTLLSWMERKKPEIYRAILEADKKSMEYFSGHGAAIAQAYNHMIMPLANSNDKRTQIVWGLKDFERRFGRKPEGMWLPETAVDTETLELLAEHGITFTILAPGQAKSVRKIGDEQWVDVSGAKVDPKRPYLCNLPSGAKIALFFYDGPVSQGIAFGGTLDSGESFAEHLLGAYSENGEARELVHIATDGETYGHHHSHGDMALAYCINHIESNKLAKVTIYAEYLEKHPPEYEVEIFENSSWSCFHGVERWRNNCGCNSGLHNEWNQEWRAPLRSALDWLRDNLLTIYEEKMKELVRDPWAARNGYAGVILDRSEEKLKAFISENAPRELSEEEKSKLLKLLEMQRHAMFMYTSCGWFFDELSGIETVQIISYAARAVQLAHEVSGISFEDSFKGLIERAKSNIGEFENGAKIYEMFVKPSILDIVRVGVHYAISSLFKVYQEDSGIYNYGVCRQKYQKLESGKQKLAVGRISMRSLITREESDITFAVLHMGDHNIVGGARKFIGEKEYEEMQQSVADAFQKADISGVIRLIDANFGEHNYSLWHLFRDEQREVLDKILSETFGDIRATSKQIYERHYPAMKVLKWLNLSVPKYFNVVMEEVLTNDILKMLAGEKQDAAEYDKITGEINQWPVKIDKKIIGYKASKRIDELVEKYEKNPADPDILRNIVVIIDSMKKLNITLNLWRAQNIFFSKGKGIMETYEAKLGEGAKEYEAMIGDLKMLEEHLRIRTK